jgi:hypothetical protein
MLGKFFSLPNLFGVVDILTLIIVSSTASNATVVMKLEFCGAGNLLNLYYSSAAV